MLDECVGSFVCRVPGRKFWDNTFLYLHQVPVSHVLTMLIITQFLYMGNLSVPQQGPLSSRCQPELQASQDSAGKVSALKLTHNKAVRKIPFPVGRWPVATFSVLPCRPLHRAIHKWWLMSQNQNRDKPHREGTSKMEVTAFRNLSLEEASHLPSVLVVRSKPSLLTEKHLEGEKLLFR